VRILVLGGTKFVGRSYVEEALAAGHEVTLFNRGVTNPDLFPEVEHVHGDRDVDLAPLRGRTWDVAFDPACYLPRHARTAAEALRDAVEHYAFVSTLGVYADEETPDQGEDGPLLELKDPSSENVHEDYGPLKVAAEREITDAFGERALILRPGFVVGPYDQIDRMPWWLRRIARGGEVLVPGEPDDPLDTVQLIDARDIARFALAMAERRHGGVFNLCAPPDGLRLERLLDICAEVTGSTGVTYTYVSEALLLEDGLDAWEPLPYWVASRYAAFRRFDASAALAAGLEVRPVRESFRDCWAWDRARGSEPLSDRAGITAEHEDRLLAAWHARALP
jgi:2'-hydroxyisoflavone reductase